MTDAPRSCCGDGERNAEAEAASNRWNPDPSALEAELPPELQADLGRFLGRESVETVGEWADGVRAHVGGGSITIDELCLADDETEHWGAVDGERYYFACFYDAVILAPLTEQPVDIRTKSPGGAVVEARAVGTDELTVEPATAAFSFGIDDAVASPSDADGPSLERGYAAICPYVRAFPSRDAYDLWARSVPASTVAMPLAGATDLAAALVR